MPGCAARTLLLPALLFALVSACGDPPQPGPKHPTDEAGEQAAAPKRTPEQLAAEIAALEVQDSVAARLRLDALRRVQQGEAESAWLDLHILYSGPVERAARDWPGHLFAGPGDYLSRFESEAGAAIEERVGLPVRVTQVTIGENPVRHGPVLHLAYGASEIKSMSTPDGDQPKLTVSLSLLASSWSDPAWDPRRDIAFFEIDDDPEWVAGQAPRRQICEIPLGHARDSLLNWLGEIAP